MRGLALGIRKKIANTRFAVVVAHPIFFQRADHLAVVHFYSVLNRIDEGQRRVFGLALSYHN